MKRKTVQQKADQWLRRKGLQQHAERAGANNCPACAAELAYFAGYRAAKREKK